MQWASESVEFRLLALYMDEQDTLHKGTASLLGELLQSIFFSVATGKLTDESRDGILKSVRSRTTRLLWPDAAREEEATEAEERSRTAGLADAVQALGSSGSFNSLAQLQGALAALKDTIAENTGDSR